MPYRTQPETIQRWLPIVCTLLLCLGPVTPLSAQQQQQQPAQGPAETATLNLNNADIRTLINTVSEVTGKNFIIDPRVKSKITVVSSEPMGKDELYEVFLSILQVHGFAAVPGDGIIKIVPDANAKQDAVPTLPERGESLSDQLVTQVVALENVGANQLVPILRPLVPQQGHLAAYAPSNMLIITDRAANITRLIDVIRRLDRPGNEEIEVIKLEYASAAEVVRIINALQQQPGNDPNAPGRPTLTADERTNSVLVTGDKAARLRIRGIIAQLDAPLDSGGNTQVVFLKYAVATDMAAILQGVASKTAEQQPQGGGGNAPSGAAGGVDIQADEANNALVITGPPAVINELERIVRMLDIPRAQVLIEAIIAEVSTDLASELGAQVLFDGRDDGDSDGPVGGSIFSEVLDLSTLAGGNAAPPPPGLTLLGGRRDGGTDFAVILRALKNDTATNILSTPTLVTMDNVEAEVVFGQNVPFLTGSYASTGGAGVVNPFQTVERQDVGLTLKVKPQINEGNAIKMTIEQEVSSVAPTTVEGGVVTNKRAIKTEVMVGDGEIIVLGGLIEDRFSDDKSKVPILGSIPILGRLFSYTRTTKVKSNLMVFIRPIILHDRIDNSYYTSHKYNLMRARQSDANIGNRGLISDPAAELPEIEVLFTPMRKKPEPLPTLDAQGPDADQNAD
ncbi:MAG TPA: type II secretion system secretin GspD [Gammaproteobacteria bacterium]